MLNFAEYELFSATKYENANNSKKVFAIISNLRFISETNVMLSWAEHEKTFITSDLV